MALLLNQKLDEGVAGLDDRARPGTTERTSVPCITGRELVVVKVWQAQPAVLS